MCGKTIHMFPQLLRVLKMRFQNKVISLPPSETPYKAFMFAKEDCWYSQRANEILQQRLAINPKDICIVGNPKSDNPGYLCAEKWTFIDSNKELKEILDVWNDPKAKYKTATFPQVFIHAHPKWYYVGGCKELNTLTSKIATTVTSTVANTQESDLLHLLPSVTEGRRNQPTQLKF